MGKVAFNFLVVATIAHALFLQIYARDDADVVDDASLANFEFTASSRMLGANDTTTEEDSSDDNTTMEAMSTAEETTETTTTVTTKTVTSTVAVTATTTPEPPNTTTVTTITTTTPEPGNTTTTKTVTVTTTAVSDGIQQVEVKGNLQMTVEDPTVYQTPKGIEMLEKSIASVAGVSPESVEATVTVTSRRRLTEDQGRRMASSSIQVDYTITLDAGDATTTNTQSANLVSAMENLPATVFLKALETAAADVGVTIDTSTISGFVSVKPVTKTVAVSILDVDWVKQVMMLTCGSSNCTIDELVTRCKEANRASNVDLCDDVDEILADVDASAEEVETLCDEEALDVTNCKLVFVEQVSSDPKGYDEDGAEFKKWLPAVMSLIFILVFNQS